MHPALMVALKGALPAPKRTVDTTALMNWLTSRELEQQSRQIDAMEKAAREAAAAAAPPKPAEPAAPSVVRENVPAPSATKGNSEGAQAPALPPPITVPAAPVPRVAPRTENVVPGGAAAQPPRLLGAQN